MAKTYENLVFEARELLQDTDSSTPRYSDATMLNILNRGLYDLNRIRPDMTYDLFVANYANVPEIVQTGAGTGQVNWDDPWGMEMQFYSTMLAYMVSVAEITDDEYAEDGRAQMLLQFFRTNAIGL